MSQFIETNGIRLHYLEHKGGQPTIILMHGLTANAHAFDGLIKEGLSPAFNVISIDLRGRGESGQPEGGYTIADHANDILGLLDKMNIQSAVIGGHSYGALLTLYLATHFPDRVEKLLIIDAAARMHENTKEMLGPALSRLGQTYPSFGYYLEKVKQAPYLDFWEDNMLSYYQADVRENQDNTVNCIPGIKNMTAAVNGVLAEPWLEYIGNVKQPALLINAPGVYTMGAALLPKENALETVNMMQDCNYIEVPGNHQTMLYGEGARVIVKAIKDFWAKEFGMQVKDSVIIITGAASGIGEAAAKQLAAAGAMIVLGDMNEEKLKQITTEIKADNNEAVYKVLNVTNEGDVKSFIDFAKQRFGKINVVLACAGIVRDSFFVTPDKETGKIKKFMTLEQWQQVIDVNLTGVFLTLREAVIEMVDNEWPGILIPVSSINKEGELGQLNYASTKAAIALWPKILAGEFHARHIKNIRIAAIAPGYVSTPILSAIKPEILQGIVNEIPIGRLIHTDEIIQAIKFIIENDAVHATTLEITGGIISKGLAK